MGLFQSPPDVVSPPNRSRDWSQPISSLTVSDVPIIQVRFTRQVSDLVRRNIDINDIFLQPHRAKGGTGKRRHGWIAKDLRPKEEANFNRGLGLRENNRELDNRKDYVNFPFIKIN